MKNTLIKARYWLEDLQKVCSNQATKLIMNGSLNVIEHFKWLLVAIVWYLLWIPVLILGFLTGGDEIDD